MYLTLEFNRGRASMFSEITCFEKEWSIKNLRGLLETFTEISGYINVQLLLTLLQDSYALFLIAIITKFDLKKKRKEKDIC